MGSEGAVLVEEGREEEPGVRTQATIFMQNPQFAFGPMHP